MYGFPGDAPLILNKEMRGSYLVQRLEEPRDPTPFDFGGGYKNGGLSDEAMGMLKRIFSFDYMGAAEFEFGAVPQALHFLARQGEAKNLVTGTVEINDPVRRSVFYICPKPYKDEVKDRINIWAQNEYISRKDSKLAKCDTKESVQLYGALRGAKYNRTLGWLELSNGFFFTIDRDMFNKTKVLFSCTD